MHFAFYPNGIGEKQEKEEQKTPRTDHLLRISQAENLTDINAVNLQNNTIT